MQGRPAAGGGDRGARPGRWARRDRALEGTPGRSRRALAALRADQPARAARARTRRTAAPSPARLTPVRARPPWSAPGARPRLRPGRPGSHPGREGAAGTVPPRARCRCSGRGKEPIATVLGLVSGRPLTEVSLNDFPSMEYADNRFIAGGLGAYVRRLAAGVPVRRATPVRAIDWSSGHLRLDTESGVLQAPRRDRDGPAAGAAGEPAFHAGASGRDPRRARRFSGRHLRARSAALAERAVSRPRPPGDAHRDAPPPARDADPNRRHAPSLFRARSADRADASRAAPGCRLCPSGAGRALWAPGARGPERPGRHGLAIRPLVAQLMVGGAARPVRDPRGPSKPRSANGCGLPARRCRAPNGARSAVPGRRASAPPRRSWPAWAQVPRRSGPVSRASRPARRWPAWRARSSRTTSGRGRSRITKRRPSGYSRVR
jgi:hypothetical protein